MTIPEERTWAVQKTRDFLRRLLSTASAGGYNGVPIEVRKAARSCLRHFPGDHDIAAAAEGAPRSFGKPKTEKGEQ